MTYNQTGFIDPSNLWYVGTGYRGIQFGNFYQPASHYWALQWGEAQSSPLLPRPRLVSLFGQFADGGHDPRVPLSGLSAASSMIHHRDGFATFCSGRWASEPSLPITRRVPRDAARVIRYLEPAVGLNEAWAGAMPTFQSIQLTHVS